MIKVINNIQELGTISLINDLHEQMAVNREDIPLLTMQLVALLPNYQQIMDQLKNND